MSRGTKSSSRPSALLAILAILAVVAGSVGCGQDAPSSPKDLGLPLFKGKPPSNPIEVDDFNPKEGAQGQTFPMTVTGSGFDTGAKVVFVLNGEDVSTISTTTTSADPTTLTADVTIDPEAAASADYEVAVEMRRGSRGVATERFTVKVPPGQFVWPQIIVEYPPRNEPGSYDYKIYGDGINDELGSTATDGSGTYTAGRCGVTGQLIDAEGYSYDAVLSPSGDWKKKGIDGCVMRTLFFDYSDELDGRPGEDQPEQSAGWSFGFMNIGHSSGDAGATTGIADDSQFDLSSLPTPWVAFPATFITDLCNNHLVFDPDYSVEAVDPRVSKVQVRRVANPYDPTKRMWEVQALPPDDIAYCQQLGRGQRLAVPRYFHMPFRLSIREQ
jgi:hypothetical protein